MTFRVFKSQLVNWPTFDEEVQRYAKERMDQRGKLGKPVPVAHHLVVSAVKVTKGPNHIDTFTPDYVVVDDTPVLTLEQKKLKLTEAVTQAEIAALEKVSPQRKRRAEHFQMADINKKEIKTPEDEAWLKAMAERSSRIDDTQRQGALMHSEIEDLDASLIDAYVIRSFV